MNGLIQLLIFIGSLVLARVTSGLALRIFFSIVLPFAYLLFAFTKRETVSPANDGGFMFLIPIFNIGIYYIGYGIGKFSKFFTHDMEKVELLGDWTRKVNPDAERPLALSAENHQLIAQELQKIDEILEEIRQESFSKVTALVDKNRQIIAYEKMIAVAKFLKVKLPYKFLPDRQFRVDIGKLEGNLEYLRKLIDP